MCSSYCNSTSSYKELGNAATSTCLAHEEYLCVCQSVCVYCMSISSHTKKPHQQNIDDQLQ